MNTNTAFTGSLKSNAFHYQKILPRSIWIVRVSHDVGDMDTTDDVEYYIITMRALKFEVGPDIPLEEYLSTSFKCLISLLVKKQTFAFINLTFMQAIRDRKCILPRLFFQQQK